jgi:hypothetical protein
LTLDRHTGAGFALLQAIASKSANQMILNSHMIHCSAQVRLQLIFGRHHFRLQTNSRFGTVTFFVGGRQNDERQHDVPHLLTPISPHPGFFDENIIPVFNYLWVTYGNCHFLTPTLWQFEIR